MIIYSFMIEHNKITLREGQAWWYTSIIPALERLRLEYRQFKASVNYIVRSCFKKKGRKEGRKRGRFRD
jgi:hypothetical protein